jgi:hypothetical protein
MNHGDIDWNCFIAELRLGLHQESENEVGSSFMMARLNMKTKIYYLFTAT